MTVVGSKAAHAPASPPNSREMVCSFVPAVGPMSPAMSTKLLNRSGCITVRSTAHVPPIDQPTIPQLALAGLTLKVELRYGTTSLVRWSATFPRGPFTHSVSLLNEPPESTNTKTGALPAWVAAKPSMVLIALPVRSQSPGVLNSPPIIITVGSFGAPRANHAGGRYTSSVRCLKPDAVSGMVTGTTAPFDGTVPVAFIAVTAMKATGTVPSKGAVVPVTIPDTASGFKHRTELVYLPPAWFARGAPKLPTVMMMGGEFNTPGDWLRTGNAISTIDGFAATHAGNAPVLVFVDSGGSFNNDTECVSGPRGNVADHLTKDVVPYLSSTFGVSPASANWESSAGRWVERAPST